MLAGGTWRDRESFRSRSVASLFVSPSVQHVLHISKEMMKRSVITSYFSPPTPTLYPQTKKAGGGGGGERKKKVQIDQRQKEKKTRAKEREKERQTERLRQTERQTDRQTRERQRAARKRTNLWILLFKEEKYCNPVCNDISKRFRKFPLCIID